MSFIYDIPADLQNKKIKRMQELMSKQGIDALVIFDSHSVRYITGFFVKGYRTISMEYEYLAIVTQIGKPMLGYVSGSDDFLVKTRCPISEAYRLPKRSKWSEFIQERLSDRGIVKGVIASDMMPFDVYASLKESVPQINIVPAEIWMELTSVKLPEEIEMIRQAVEIASKGMLVAIDTVKPGVSELDVSVEAEYAIRKAGSEVIPYIFQVASGPNSAIFERISTNRVIESGDLVAIDLGAVVGGYLSEFARTVIVGEPSDIQREISKVQLDSLAKAKEVARPGVSCSEVDKQARQVIIDAGYEKYMHRFNTGHQLGYGIHGEPPISKTSNAILKKNMVINLEPRVNLFDQPQVGGVINEDTLLLTENGSEQLTKVPYDSKLLK